MKAYRVYVYVYDKNGNKLLINIFLTYLIKRKQEGEKKKKHQRKFENSMMLLSIAYLLCIRQFSFLTF